MNNFSLERTEVLKTISTEWNFSTDADPELLEQNMINFMIENRGIGLAANQISIPKRIFVMGSYDSLEFPRPFALFNPKIIESSDEIVLDKEGCLSYPGLWLNVKRPSWIVGSYQDSKGIERNIKLDGYAAKCFQHELDHLNGVCFVDKVSQLKLQLAMKKLRKK
jgi:peptide deformylase